MQGNNTLKLNQATMIEALQLWCAANFKEPPIVKSVHENNGIDHTFTIEVEAPSAPTKD